MHRPFVLTSERHGLAVLLDQQRDALVRKVAGLSEDDARRTPGPSSLSLLSLLKHCAVWEVRWPQGVVAGRSLNDGWPEREEDQAEFTLTQDDTLERWLRLYEGACATSRAVAASVDLEAPCARTDIIDCNVRWVLLHLIEETARHAGHADIIREALDGMRGL
jgi:hypothetical protein